MKKLTGIIALSCLLTFPTFAGGYSGPGVKTFVKTAAEAAKAKDDTRVELTGYIVKSLGDEKYLFRDDSGEVQVEIDDKLWRGLTASDTTKVTLMGEVDDEWFGNEVEIKHIRLAAE